MNTHHGLSLVVILLMEASLAQGHCKRASASDMATGNFEIVSSQTATGQCTLMESRKRIKGLIGPGCILTVKRVSVATKNESQLSEFRYYSPGVHCDASKGLKVALQIKRNCCEYEFENLCSTRQNFRASEQRDLVDLNWPCMNNAWLLMDKIDELNLKNAK